MGNIVIATPFPRYDFIIPRLEKILAAHRVLRISTKEGLNDDVLSSLNPLWIFFPHWSWKIPKQIHEKYNCVIFHMTDLPFGRGGSPLQNLIVRGYKQTMLSAIKCVSEIDAGPIYKKVPLSLEGTAEDILKRAAVLMGEIIVFIIEKNPMPSEQIGEVVTFKRRRMEEGDICNLQNIDQVYDFIRMLDAENYPHAFLQTKYLRFEFVDAHLETDYIEAKVVIRRLTNE